ncbi:MAG: hypothetical protein ABIP67_01620 [Burkholderiales bacterium]
MDKYTENEYLYIKNIHQRFLALRTFLASVNLSPNASIDDYFAYVSKLRAIQGNTSNELSFIACLMAKHYLGVRFDIGDLDVALKPQGAPGLDIDLITSDSKRIIGEIKTTVPYSGARNDLGAQQRTTFKHDFDKLNEAKADYKFFFLTDQKTYDVVMNRYVSFIPDVEIVLLSSKQI